MLQTHHYHGTVELGETINLTFYTTNASGSPAAPSVGPTYNAYGPTEDVMPNGSGTATNFASTVGLYRISLTPSATDGYERGQSYDVAVTYTATIPKGEIHRFTVT